MARRRLDLLLVERGLAETRALAQRLILAGEVRVNGQVERRPSAPLPEDAILSLERGPRFVSRGGEKLDAALQAFGLDVSGRVCADVGASTGGFTDCLLQRGAARVYAIDVGKGQLHWKLRSDPRVVVMEETNARFVERLPEPVSLVTLDASFISLKILLPVVKGWTTPPAPHLLAPRLAAEQAGEVIALIKPQFEAGRRQSARGKGVIRDPEAHRAVLLDVLTFAAAGELALRGLIRSPLTGPKGNVEFLAWWQTGPGGLDPAGAVEEVLAANRVPETNRDEQR